MRKLMVALLLLVSIGYADLDKEVCKKALGLDTSLRQLAVAYMFKRMPYMAVRVYEDRLNVLRVAEHTCKYYKNMYTALQERRKEVKKFLSY